MLNEFLNSEEVQLYENERLGRTTLVFLEGSLVAYYTVSNDFIRKEYLKTVKGFSKFGRYHIEGIPAITIGRLAVDSRWQGKGIGKILVQRIMAKALKTSRNYGVRLILVQAKEKAFGFYEILGFQFVVETKREKKRFRARGTRTMFFDLNTIMDLADSD